MFSGRPVFCKLKLMARVKRSSLYYTLNKDIAFVLNVAEAEGTEWTIHIYNNIIESHLSTEILE